MQNMQEYYHYDLLSQYSDYQNAEFEVIKIEPLNQYSKDKALPNYTISEMNQEINFIEFQKKYQSSSQQYNLKKYPITLLLFNTNLVIIQFIKNDNNIMLIKDHKEYNLLDFVNNIHNCTTLYGLFDDLKVNIDCTTQDQDFLNLNIEIKLDQTLNIENIVVIQNIYNFFNLNGFDDNVIKQEWSNCKKKEIKYLSNKGQINRIFYCLYYNLNQQRDQLIFLEQTVVQYETYEIIEIYILDKNDFKDCNNDIIVDQFNIKQLIVNSINIFQDFTQFERYNKWIMSLLLVDRYGICKCGNLRDEQIECDFLELQEGQYTSLYSSSYLDEIQYIYVASEVLLYKINYYFTFETDQDRIEGYYYIKQDGYIMSKMHIFYDYLIVIMQEVIQNNFDAYVKQKLLFFQKKYNIKQYVPNYILDSTNRYQVLRINFEEFPGNYYLQYDLQEQILRLNKIQYKHLVFQYDKVINDGNYLLFKITFQINCSSIISNDVFKLLITSYQDNSFLTIKENQPSSYEFKSEQFHFQLNENLLGPLLNYHEIEWQKQKDSTSIIEYIREIKFHQSTNIFKKVFVGLFVYNEVNAYFTITGVIQNEENDIVLAQQQFKYDKIQFIEDGKLKYYKFDEFKFKNIDFVNTNILTSIVGNKNENKFILCFHNQYGSCSLLAGDFSNSNENYDYIYLSELRSKNDTLYAIPQSRDKVDIYSLNYEIWSKSSLNLTKVGVIDSQTIKELMNVTIFDSHFQMIDDKLSFLLLSDGTILSLTTQYSIQENTISIKIVNKIQEYQCIPNSRNSSRIFIQFHNNQRVLVYICVENANKQILKEYDLQNPYNPIFIRRYPLYNYRINEKLKPFNDQKVIYIPVETKGYLAYSPFFVSPNVLLHLIPIIKDSLINAIPVIVNNFDTNEWNIFSMAFFYDELGGNLFYLNSNPTYYGTMNGNISNDEKMIMVYQQNQDDVIFKQFNISFDYTETQICVDQNHIEKETEDHNVSISLNELRIQGAVEDVQILELSNNSNTIIQRNDILELKQYISNHYESLQYGRVFDILDMNQTEFLSIINSTAIENNLIFAVSQNYFLIFEKQRQTTKKVDRISLLKEIKLTQLNNQLFNLKQCRLSINNIDQVMLYCYKYNSGNYFQNYKITKAALYFLINFQYDYNNSKIEYTIQPFKIDLGSRLQIETISPIKYQGKIFQFIKYNFENSQDQYELICGYIENGEFKAKQTIQSSTFDYNILGQLSFDITLWDDDQYILILTLDIHELRIFLFNLDQSTQQLKKVKEEKFSYAQLNQYLFKSFTQYRLETIHLLDCQIKKCLVLLGVPDKFFEFHLLISINNSSIILKQHTFLNYFRCIHKNKFKPQIVLNGFQEITQLVAACVKQDIEKNFFFEDKFDYQYDDLLVFVQIFQKQSLSLDSFPIRIYRFFFDISIRDTFHFILYIREPDNQIHILFENETYFLVDYQKQDQIQFLIKSNHTGKNQVTSKLVLSNIFKSKTIDLSINFNVPHQTSNTWIYVTISVVLAIILIVLGILKYLSIKKKNLKQKKALAKSLIDLDDVLKEVILGEVIRNSQIKVEGNDSEKSF